MAVPIHLWGWAAISRFDWSLAAANPDRAPVC